MRRDILPWAVVVILSGPVAAVPAEDRAENLPARARAVLAQLDGDLPLSGLREPVEVLRDRWGVPHLYAKNQDDLFFAQGVVAAQDRLFQIDWWRRVAVGETAEVFGRDRLEADRFARLVRYRGDPDAEWASYSPDTQRIAAAFTKGINAYIDHLGDRLPIEFQMLGYRPKKWRPEDVLGRMAGLVMIRNFGSEVSRAALVAAVGPEKARLLAPTDPPRDFGPAPGLDLTGIDDTVLAGYKAATRAMTFASPRDGSNNWVLDGTRSASGKPMLASDPHRALTLPSLRYLVHLNAPGWNVIGSGEPALPGVALGHNDRLAWGITIVGTDQADLFVETTHPDDPDRYGVGGGWEKMTILHETISVKGQEKPEVVELRFTRHGPVIHLDPKRHRAFALRWVGAEPGTAGYLGSLALDRAQTREEFVKALAGCKVPSLNTVYADVDGNIGWVAAALTPVRRKGDGLLPVPGGESDSDWQRFLDVKELPQVHNPPEHFVATANHNILPANYPHVISYEWATNSRMDRIRSRLAAKDRFTLADFQGIQHDVTTIPGQRLVRLAREWKPADPQLDRPLQVLRSWDGVLSREAAAGPLYAVWLRTMLDEFFRPHVSGPLLEFVRSGYGVEVLLAALEKPTAPWFGPDPQRARDAFLHKTLTAAVAKLDQLQPGGPLQWSWGKLHTAGFVHPLAGLGREYARAFNLQPVPRPGDGFTPLNARYDDRYRQIHGASYRQVFDLADWDRGLATSTPGQSGQPGSPFYANLLPLWADGTYFPLAFSRNMVDRVTQHRLRLCPAHP